MWSRLNIADLVGSKPKLVGNKTAEISRALKIGYFDKRFCRKEVADRNSFKRFKMTSIGLFIPNDENEF